MYVFKMQLVKKLFQFPVFFPPMKSLLSILFYTGNLSWPCIHCWVINPPIWAEMLNVLLWFWLDKSLGLKKVNLCWSRHCGKV